MRRIDNLVWSGCRFHSPFGMIAKWSLLTVIVASRFGIAADPGAVNGASGGKSATVEADAADAPQAKTQTEVSWAEIDAAVARIRDRGVLVNELPRDHANYRMHIITSDGSSNRRKTAERIDDDAMNDIEIICRDVPVELYLRGTLVTARGLDRIATARIIKHLELAGNNVDNEMIKSLPKLPLQGVGIKSDSLNDQDLSPLSKCLQLNTVSLSGNLLTDSCLEYLVELPNLRSMDLGNNFTKTAFTVLSPLKDLKDLIIAENITPDINDFARFPNLRRITLTGAVRDDRTALAVADSLKSLEHATLRSTSITNAGVQHLARIKTLTRLWLSKAPVDDDVAESIRQMKQLKELVLDDCDVSDAVAAAISECPDLAFVNLSRTLVTDKGIAELAKSKSIRQLNVRECRGVTDGCIDALIQLNDRESLHINLMRTGVTSEGSQRLQQALPNANIAWGAARARPR